MVKSIIIWFELKITESSQVLSQLVKMPKITRLDIIIPVPPLIREFIVSHFLCLSSISSTNAKLSYSFLHRPSSFVLRSFPFLVLCFYFNFNPVKFNLIREKKNWPQGNKFIVMGNMVSVVSENWRLGFTFSLPQKYLLLFN